MEKQIKSFLVSILDPFNNLPSYFFGEYLTREVKTKNDVFDAESRFLKFLRPLTHTVACDQVSKEVIEYGALAIEKHRLECSAILAHPPVIKKIKKLFKNEFWLQDMNIVSSLSCQKDEIFFFAPSKFVGVYGVIGERIGILLNKNLTDEGKLRNVSRAIITSSR